MRRAFFVLALANLLGGAWVIWDATVSRRPWIAVQEDFNRRLVARGEAPVAIEIRQVVAAAPVVSNGMKPAAQPGAVDRCPTCHLAVDREDWTTDALPAHLRTHPRRNELLGAHPVERFGCTACHDGQGTQIKGIARAAFAHGRDDPYWERPLRSGAFVEASCVACHEIAPAAAAVYRRGRRLFRDLRCGACHLAEGVPPPPANSAPPLAMLTVKSDRAFVVDWLADPRAFRPRTRMPSFWPRPVDPQGVPLPDDAPATLAWRASRERETAAIADFLGSLPAPALTPVPLPAVLDDAALVAAGQGVFERVGCRGCHLLGSIADGRGLDATADTEAPDSATATPIPDELRHGPALDRIGEKASAPWLASWLRDPQAVFANARMPNLRLSDAEIGQLVAFLVAQRQAGKPAIDPGGWAQPTAAPDSIAEGNRLVQNYGCFGCHEIPGAARGGRPGPDLDSFGAKTPEEITFGDARMDCGVRSILECFAVEKIRTPRRFAGAGVERLVMPDFDLAPDEALALAVFTVAQRPVDMPSAVRRTTTKEELALAAFEDLAFRLNCRGCHEIGRLPIVRPPASPSDDQAGDDEADTDDDEPTTRPNGGAILRYYEEASAGPPPLTFAGAKLQQPWLASFVPTPTAIRPWLDVRMPTFNLDDATVGVVIAGFAARSQVAFPELSMALPTRPQAAAPADAQALFDRLLCRKCHPGTPEAARAATTTGTASAAELAPDLALVPTRLRPTWVRDWIADPQSFDRETRMPAYFTWAEPDPEQPPGPDAPSNTPSTAPSDAPSDASGVTRTLEGGLPDLAGGNADAQVDALVWWLYHQRR